LNQDWEPGGPPWLVEDETGELHRVSDSAHCSCGRGACEHQRRAAAASTPSRSLVYTAKSGLHKELRRGRQEQALGWASILERASPGTVVTYLRRIVCEETRNLDLLCRLNDLQRDSWPELVSLFCRSKKDWEIGLDWGWWSPEWVMCAAGDGGGAALKSVVGAALVAGADADSLALELFRLAAERRPDHRDALECAANRRENDELSLLLQIADGRWSDEAMAYGPESAACERVDVPWPADYVWDCHTWRGFQNIAAASPPLRFGEPLPAGLDLRWSGAEAGTLWRYLAWREYGTCEVPWEAVTPAAALREANAALVTAAWMDWKGIPPEVV